MNKRFGFSNEMGATLDYGIHFLSYPVFDFGTEKIDSIEVPGRVGTLTRRTGEYSDTTIENDMEFRAADRNEHELKMLEIRKFLKSTGRAVYTDMEEYYFRVKKVGIDDIKKKYGIFGNVTVTFLCDPVMYLQAGDTAVPISRDLELYNAWSESHPVIRITGEGVCKVSVNGKEVSANVGQNLTIDTDLMQAYRKDGMLNNTALTGNYEDLYLQEGQNKISVSSGFTAEIIPRWGVRL